MSEHKTGKSNWTPEQKERYWQARKAIAALGAMQRRNMRRLLKYTGIRPDLNEHATMKTE